MVDVAVDFLLDNLKQQISRNSQLTPVEKDELKSLYEELGFLRTFLKDSENKRYEQEEMKHLVTRIRDVVYEAEDLVDTLVHARYVSEMRYNVRSEINDYIFYRFLSLKDIMEEMKTMKREAMSIYELYFIGAKQAQNTTFKTSSSSPSRAKTTSTVESNDIFLGFDDEVKTIRERLTGEQRNLDIISIVGMAGLGKTTLARKLYEDPFITYHFYIRAWINVSQAYQKRDLLLGILNYVIHLTDQFYTMSDENLSREVYRRLQGKRYLLVIDDVWNKGAWDDLKRSFPDDDNGSRVMLTSRLADVALHAKVDSPPHLLRFFSKEESWDLLCCKVFHKESCPSELIGIGMRIAKKCQGLPLVVAVIAGILTKTGKTRDQWKQVAKSVSSYVVTDPKAYMETLALSYNHLPPHLKACFLYLGAFPEDHEIPAQELIWLWIAEGFIPREEKITLEEAAEDCLKDLIDRSLVIIAQKRSNGAIRACHIHDLLRDLGLGKAKEDKFMQRISGSEHVSSSPTSSSSFLSFTSSSFSSFPSSPTIPVAFKQRRLCITSNLMGFISSRPSCPRIRSLLCYELESVPREWTSFFYQAFKLIRVLDLKSTHMRFFPKEIGHLIHLRYLAIRSVIEGLGFPPEISYLYNLETLIVLVISGTPSLPLNIGKMVNLRHVYVRNHTSISTQGIPSCELPNLQSISLLQLSSGDEKVLLRIRNIRKLGCEIRGSSPRLDSLIQLDTLKMIYDGTFSESPVRFPSMDEFPPNLKKLTLSRFSLPWTEISTIGRLPNLEVLKLLGDAFKGPLWDTSDEEFLQLKFLKLQDLDIEQWNASGDHFPSLRQLVVAGCKNLQEIPTGLGDISALEKIELKRCSSSIVESAREIQEEQQCMGNDGLKIFIYLN